MRWLQMRSGNDGSELHVMVDSRVNEQIVEEGMVVLQLWRS